jgi:hypothetical protein
MAMAEDDDNSTVPADRPSSTPGNQHFLGRYKSTQHNLLPALRQTAYPTPRDTVLDFVYLAREIANSPDAAEKIREKLKEGSAQLEAAANALLNTLDDIGQSRLATVMSVAFLIAEHSNPRRRRQVKASRLAREGKARLRQEEIEEAGKLFAERSKEYKRPPKGKIAAEVAPLVKRTKKTVLGWNATPRMKPPKAR